MHQFDVDRTHRTLRWYEWLIFLLLFFFVAGVRAAPVYRCTDVRGEIAFQDRPCLSEQQQSMVDAAPAPAWRPSPQYAVEKRDPESSTQRSRSEVSVSSRDAREDSWQCRSSDGQVFYRHGACPRSIQASEGGTHKGKTGTTAKTVSVHATRIPREEACGEMRRAGAIGRSGHQHDEDVSIYDKNLGHDLCH